MSHGVQNPPNRNWSPLIHEKLGPVFEMQAVEMIPAAPPDEAVAFENLDDLLRDLVAPDDGAVRSLRPQPVIAKLRIDVDGRPEGVHRQAVGRGDRPAIINAGCRNEILDHLGGDRRSCRCGEVVDGGIRAATGRNPVQPDVY